MKDMIHILTALTCDPWLITPQMHKILTDIAVAHAHGGSAEEMQHQLAASMPANAAKQSFAVDGQTAIIRIEGVIGRKFSNMLQSSGVVSVDVADRMLHAAIADENIDSILMVFDSPGGVGMGVPECANTIRQAKAAGKGVVAYIDGLCCSAAYWMASQCNIILGTPSGTTASIGAYTAILDQSRAAEMAGIKVEVFKSGPHKGMGMAGTSLTDAQRAMLQANVDRLGADFKAAVRSGRERAIPEDVMQGQSIGVKEAIAVGLVDAESSLEAALSDAKLLGKIRSIKR